MTQLQRCRYSLVKYGHDPLRQEFVNVGVVIWRVDAPAVARWRFDGTMKRVEKLYPSANPRAVKTALAAFKQMVETDPGLLSSGIGGTGSIVVTEPRGVRCADMDVEIADLFDTLVTPAEADAEEPREKHRSSRYLKGRMNEFFKKLGVLKQVTDAQELRIVDCKSGVKHAFDFAYRKGVVHRIDTLSFDHGTNSDRIVRARSFANLVTDIVDATRAEDNAVIEAVVQVPTESLQLDIYEEAKKILNTLPSPKLKRIEVRDDSDLGKYCEQTKTQLAA